MKDFAKKFDASFGRRNVYVRGDAGSVVNRCSPWAGYDSEYCAALVLLDALVPD